jgi:hypothetical protein
MGGKAKSRCRCGMLKANNLRHSYLNIMTLENCSGQQGNVENIITKPHKNSKFHFVQ